MGRLSRFAPAGQPQHVVQRGNNRSPVFFVEDDYRFYLKCLGEACEHYRCDVHAYVLMTNHVHLLVTPGTDTALTRVMQSLGRRYAQRINWRYVRTGTLWEGRFRSGLVDSDEYFLTCSRYIELNPVRARLVHDPLDYPWSSYGANAWGHRDELVRPHPLYRSFGRAPEQRAREYRALFDLDPDPAILVRIRAGVRTRGSRRHELTLAPTPVPTPAPPRDGDYSVARTLSRAFRAAPGNPISSS